MDIESKLNKKQAEAVKKIEGPVMVFAGAGTGKTRTLTYRVAYMVKQGIDPKNILAITFTNKATNEMRKRLNELIPGEHKYLTISTFHSLCARILRKTIQVLGYDNHFDIVDDEDQLKYITEAIKRSDTDKRRYTPRHMRTVINNCKCFLKRPEYAQEIVVYDEYEEIMKEYNSLDFEDLLLKVYEIFNTQPDILERYRDKFKYILVDEFQDTNTVQYKIVKLLAEKSKNIFVVGDDDQSIYAFRGSNYENIELFLKDFPDTTQIVLEENYRSTQTILDGSNNIIKNNTKRKGKELFSAIPGDNSNVIINQLVDDRAEVDYVVRTIKKLHSEGLAYKEIAILYRSSAVSRSFELGLVQNDIPYKIYGGVSYLRRKEVKDIIGYLKLIINQNDIANFKRIVNVPSRGIGAKTIDKVLDSKKEMKLSLFATIEAIKDKLGKKYNTLSTFAKNIMELNTLLDDTPLDEYMDILLERTNYMSAFDDDENKKDRKENVEEFRSILYGLENNGEIAKRREKLIEAFDEAILSDDKLQNQKQSLDGVTLSTVHSVKGLEFNTVFIVAFENGIFPNHNYYDDMDMEEERRIVYVACTRAKRKLYMTCAKKRMLYGHYNRNSQSMFMLEFVGKRERTPKDFDTEDFDISQITSEQVIFDQETNAKDMEFEEGKNIEFNVGDTIYHEMYGEGIVVSLDKTNYGLIGTICFTDRGKIKQFDLNHKSIKKVKK